MIVGISGKAESGKDVVASRLVQAHGFTRHAFADAIKVAYFDATFGGASIDTDKGKIAWVDANKHHAAVRSRLQEIGQARRAEDPDYWVAQVWAWQSAHGIEGLVIPDVRYKNEAEAIKRRNGLVIRVERPGHGNQLTPEQRAHTSECDLDDYEGFDLILGNTGTIEDLERGTAMIPILAGLKRLVASQRPVYLARGWK